MPRLITIRINNRKTSLLIFVYWHMVFKTLTIILANSINAKMLIKSKSKLHGRI